MSARQLIGYLCVALGFAVIVMLGYGVIDPIGDSGATSIGALLLALMPSVLLALAAFVVGLWLLKGSRGKGANKR